RVILRDTTVPDFVRQEPPFFSLECSDLTARLHHQLRKYDDAKKDEDEDFHGDDFQGDGCWDW
ncbi:hypothetical protein, partial, partial [Absidia glauca]